MNDTDPSARVQPRSVGQLLHPACCALCGNGTCLKGYVDPAIFYEWEGQVYFCYNCTVQMAEVVGCLPPDQSEFLANQNKELAERLTALEQELDHARDRLVIFDAAIANAVSSSLGSITGGSGNATVEESDESADESNVSGEGSNPVAVKSVKKRRPNDSSRITISDGSSTLNL